MGGKVFHDWCAPFAVLGFNGCSGNLRQGLVMSPRIFRGSALFLLPKSVLEVAHIFEVILIQLEDFRWNLSSSTSRTDCKADKRSGCCWSGNSEVGLPSEVKHISAFNLERRSQPNREPNHSRKEGFSVKDTRVICAG